MEFRFVTFGDVNHDELSRLWQKYWSVAPWNEHSYCANRQTDTDFGSTASAGNDQVLQCPNCDCCTAAKTFWSVERVKTYLGLHDGFGVIVERNGAIVGWLWMYKTNRSTLYIDTVGIVRELVSPTESKLLLEVFELVMRTLGLCGIEAVSTRTHVDARHVSLMLRSLNFCPGERAKEDPNRRYWVRESLGWQSSKNQTLSIECAHCYGDEELGDEHRFGLQIGHLVAQLAQKLGYRSDLLVLLDDYSAEPPHTTTAGTLKEFSRCTIGCEPSIVLESEFAEVSRRIVERTKSRSVRRWINANGKLPCSVLIAGFQASRQTNNSTPVSLLPKVYTEVEYAGVQLAEESGLTIETRYWFFTSKAAPDRELH